MRRLVIGAALVLTTACGNGDGDNGGFRIEDSTGTGSETLRVTASLEVVGDGSPDNLSVVATIAVRDQANVPASEAVVTLQWTDGSLILIEDPVGTGIFVIAAGDVLPFSLAYALHIERGVDLLEDVTIATPILHEMVSPLRFDNHFALQPMDLEWTGAGTAEEYRIELDSNLDPHTTWQDGDPGTFRIEGTFFAASPGAYTEIVTVRRKRTLQLTGSLPASSLSIELRQDVDPIAINPPTS